MRHSRRAVVTGALFALLAQPVRAQRGERLTGTLLDPSDRPVPGIAIALTSPTAERVSVTTESGEFTFLGVTPGKYELRARASGFNPIVRSVAISSRPLTLILKLTLTPLKEEITVPSEPPGLTVDPSGNRDAISVERGLLDNLPILDMNYLAAFARFLDPTAPAGEPPDLIVDGMPARNLGVTSSAIQEITINQNPYTAEYPRWSRRRIEIITKAATEQYHGTVNFLLRDHRLNTRDAFAIEKPREQRKIYEGSLLGPIGSGKGSSFLLSALHEDEDLQSVVFAAGPDGPIRFNTPTPATNSQLSLRLSRQLTSRQAAFWQLNYQDRSIKNQNVTSPMLPEAGTLYRYREDEFLFNHRMVVSEKLLSQFRILLGRYHAPLTSLVDQPQLVVTDAYISGGAQADNLRTEAHTSMAWIVTQNAGQHTLKYGINVPDWSRRGYSDRGNRLGTYYFESLDALRARTPFAAILQRGEPRIVFVEKVLGGFLQDEWRPRSDLSVAAGLRYDWQNYFDDANNFAPRLALAWSPGRGRSFVIRAGAGVFYDRSGPAPIADILRLDGAHIQRYVLTGLTGYPVSDESLLRQMAAARVRQGSTHPPYTMQFNAGIERQLAKGTTLAVNYIGNRSVHQFRSRDLNAPLPPAFESRPDPALGVVRQIEPSGRIVGNALEITLRGQAGKRLSGMALYTFGRVMSDTGGLNWFPADSFHPQGEWGRYDTDRTHQLTTFGSANLHEWLSFGFSASLSSGPPFNITTGRDENRDGLANDRPPGVARNTGQGPGYAVFDIRWSKKFRLKKTKELPNSLTISVDAFNVLNHVNYTGFAGAMSSPFSGQPVAAHPPRRVQLGLRYEF